MSRFLLVFLMLLPLSVHAATWSAFCWTTKVSGVYCTDIGPSPAPILTTVQCNAWSASVGGGQHGWKRGTDLNQLKKDQADACNYVANKPKWQCFYKTFDAAGTHFHHDMGPQIFGTFANDEVQAEHQCVDVAGAKYLEALKSLAPGESLAPAAVMTIP